MKRGSKSEKLSKLRHSRIPSWIYWLPRIASILFLLFLALFSLDVFDTNFDFWSVTIGLLMHNIPVFILTILLIIAWKHEWVGAIAFILGGLSYIAWLVVRSITEIFEWYYLSWSLIIAAPAFAVGILFWINWKMKKRYFKHK